MNSKNENLQLADGKARLKAFVIDDLLITLIMIIVVWDKVQNTNGDIEVLMNIMNSFIIEIIIFKFIYQTFFIWYYGATIGKIVAKIRVIDSDTLLKVSFVNSVIRSIGRIGSEFIFYLGFFLFFFIDSKQTLHDKVGRTLVVNG